MNRRPILWVLWPSFMVSAAASLAMFALIDPHGVTVFGRDMEASREALYTAAFFFMWLSTAASSALSLGLLPGGFRRLSEESEDVA